MNKRKCKKSRLKMKLIDNKPIKYLHNTNGITLITLVISIIVMLILAGVSLNATIGENGIIAKAKSTMYIQSCAELEEFFNQLYIQNFDKLDKSKNKVEAIRGMHINWFYSTLSDEYVTDASGHALYLLKKSEFLKDNPDYNLIGGDAGDGTYRDYYNLNDVYGVTSDLKVYYCSNGIETIYGVAESELDNEDFGRIIISSDSNLSKIISHSSEAGVNVSEARSVSELIIDENTGINNLQELYKLSGLKKIIIKNMQNGNLNLQGIENIVNLNYLCFYNCSLNDYTEISKLNKLEYLYLYNSNDSEVEKIFNTMKNTDYNNLQYLGIFGTPINSSTSDYFWYQNDSGIISNVTNVDSLKNLTVNTKLAVKYLYLNNNKISSISCLDGFYKVEHLLVNRNALTNLNGIENMKDLYILSVQANKELNDINAISNLTNLQTFISYRTNLNNIKVLKDKTSLTYLNLANNKQLQDVSDISTLENLKTLYLAGCTNMNIESVKSIRYIYNQIKISSKSIDNKYVQYLDTEDTKNLASNNLSDSDIYDKLANMVEIEKLNLNDNKSLANTDFYSLSSELQSKIIERLGNNENSKTNDAYFRYILSTLTNMKNLTIRNISNLKSIDFVRYMPNLVELDLIGTGVTDLSILEELKNSTGDNTLSKLSILIIDNSNIDLTKIQNTISSLYDKSASAYWSYTGDKNYSGLRIGNSELLTKENTSLGYCNKITKLKLSFVNDSITANYFDLSKMTSLKIYSGIYATSVVKLPASVEKCYQTHCNFPIFESSVNNPSQLVVFDNDNSGETTQNALNKMFESLATCQTSKEIWLDIHSVYNVQNFDGLEKMQNCKFSKIYLNPWYAKIENLDVFSKFEESATGYIKILQISGSRKNSDNYSKTIISELPDLSNLKVNSLYIRNCGVSDFKGVTENKNISLLNLENNNIQNLENLLNMKQLEKISFAGNNIYNTYNDAINNRKVNNLEILKRISDNSGNGYNVSYVDMQNNYLEENDEYINMRKMYDDSCKW